MAAKTMPDAAYLRECFDYNPETGELTWRRRPRAHFGTYKGWRMWSCRYPGAKVGRKDQKGYTYVKIDHSGWFAHRIIWVLQTGDDPGPLQIDHCNCDKSDNRWGNLRLATHWQNRVHSPGWKKSGLPKGVTKSWRRFHAACKLNGRRHYLGTFATAEEASAAYLAFVRPEHGEFVFEPKPT